MSARRLLEAALLAAAAGVFWLILVSAQGRIAQGPAFDLRFTTATGSEAVRRVEPPPAWLLPVDDAYIFIRYAQQAARGQPMEWSPGEPSSGASSFLYPWLLVPGQWLDSDPETQVATWSRWSRLVGAAGLALLGWAAAFLLRRLGLDGPWPFLGGLAAVWSGPIGLTSLGGMESGLNAAALCWALGLFVAARESADSGGRRRVLLLLVVAALLPWLRPENGVLTLLLAGWIAWGRLRGAPRWAAPLILVPGGLLALLNVWVTGHLSPAGAIAKSWLNEPHATPWTVLGRYWEGLVGELLPVYLGTAGWLLWPPVGVAALAVVAVVLLGLAGAVGKAESTAPAAEILRRARPLVAVWMVLVALAPISGVLYWQAMRHHQAGLVCAWLLAVLGLALVARRLRAMDGAAGKALGRIGLPLVLGVLLLASLPRWAVISTQWAAQLHYRHGESLSWLQRHGGEELLLVNDAGVPALAHDGPLVDLIGLGTPAFTEAYRHGPGAVVETLARLPALPTLAAINPDVAPFGPILGPPLTPMSDPEHGTLIARPRAELLATTAPGPGWIDLALLPDERRIALDWSEPARGSGASLLLVLDGGRGLEAQGCRPLRGSVRLDVGGLGPVRTLRVGAANGEAAVLEWSDGRRCEIPAGAWIECAPAATATTGELVVRAAAGEPCLEAVRLGG